METVAIFGGTFDPIHYGHLSMADAILRDDLADTVLFLPAKIPPHKLGKKIAPDKVRLRMLLAVLKENMEICTCELEREKGITSYSYQTVRELRAISPEKQFKFVMGMDSLNTLQFWREFDAFIEETEFIVFTRPGQEIPTIERLTENFNGRQDLAQKMLDAIIIHNFPFSSTEVREASERGADLSDYVPVAVVEIIDDCNIYNKSHE